MKGAVRDYDSVRYLQITAPISPGSSGGPVLNGSGQMVGVATFQFTKGQNLNFAVAAENIPPLLAEHFHVSIAEFESIMEKSVRTKPHEASATAASPTVIQDEPWTGQFDGIVHNLSADLSAGFEVLVEDREGSLSGCMGVVQPLFGSGPVEGYAQGDDATFTVKSAIGKIVFSGHRIGRTINGTYTVDHGGGMSEEGRFTLKRTNKQGPSESFDTVNCPTDAEMNTPQTKQ